jgi:hypothetical protein
MLGTPQIDQEIPTLSNDVYIPVLQAYCGLVYSPQHGIPLLCQQMFRSMHGIKQMVSDSLRISSIAVLPK